VLLLISCTGQVRSKQAAHDGWGRAGRWIRPASRAGGVDLGHCSQDLGALRNLPENDYCTPLFGLGRLGQWPAVEQLHSE
jgi:hypothetical protein